MTWQGRTKTGGNAIQGWLFWQGVETMMTWTGSNHLIIYDLSDPARPKYIRDYGMPGQQPGATSYIGHIEGGRRPPRCDLCWQAEEPNLHGTWHGQQRHTHDRRSTEVTDRIQEPTHPYRG